MKIGGIPIRYFSDVYFGSPVLPYDTDLDLSWVRALERMRAADLRNYNNATPTTQSQR